ncbi:MAG: DinB family protein [Phycisphaerales bacterium]
MNTAVERFIADASALVRLVEPLSREELLAHPVPGTWSLQTLVLHVLDSDLIATHRMKRVIAEERPLLISYDETAFAQRLGYDRLDARLAADLFRLNRLQTGEILRTAPETAFARVGVHNQRGLVTLAEFVALYVHHVEHHFVFARAKLLALGRTPHV